MPSWIFFSKVVCLSLTSDKRVQGILIALFGAMIYKMTIGILLFTSGTWSEADNR